MKIGFLGGSFDPIHLGHINLAIEAKEKAGLDEVILSPAYVSPHKLDTPPRVNGDDRLKMVELAVEGIEGISVWDYELKRHEPSFTIEALLELKQERGADVQIFTLLEQDLCKQFHTWKNFEEIFEIAPPTFAGGDEFSEKMLINLPEKYHQIVKKNFIQIFNMSISSTRIRERRKKDLYISHLLPAKVLDYIYKNQLYL